MKKAVLVAISLLMSTPAFMSAQVIIEGTTGPSSIKLGYISSFQNVEVISGSATLPDSGVVFCFDGSLHWPGFNVTRQYTLSSTPDFAIPVGADKALGLLNYIVENYYEVMLTDPAWGPNSGYEMNMAIWEISGDYDGTLASVDATMGGISADMGTVPGSPHYTAIINDLRTNYDSISSSYRSTKYDLHFLIESDPAYQPLLMISPIVTPVPEPSSMFLCGLALLGWITRRQRR